MPNNPIPKKATPASARNKKAPVSATQNNLSKNTITAALNAEQVELESLRAQVKTLLAKVAVTNDLESQVRALRE